jgi:hypothetical protein
MMSFRVDFVKRSRPRAVWPILAVSVAIVAWSAEHFLDALEAARQSQVPGATAMPVAIDSERERAKSQAIARAVQRRDALSYAWAEVLTELENLSDSNTAVLKFEGDRRDGSLRATVHTTGFAALQKSLDRVRRTTTNPRHWRIVSVSNEPSNSRPELRVEISATRE